MWLYYGRVFWAAWNDFKAATREQIIGALLAFAILLCQIQFGAIHRADVQASVWSVAWPYTLLLAGLLLWHLIRAPWGLDAKRVKELGDSRKEFNRLINQNADLKQEAENKVPLLNLDVHESLARLGQSSVDVFVDVSIGNTTPGTACTVSSYQLTLERGTVRYASQKALHDLTEYNAVDLLQTAQGKPVKPYFGNPQPLTDLAAGISHREPIVYGAPHRGWLHFHLDNMPKWPTLDDQNKWHPSREYIIILEVWDPFNSGAEFMATLKIGGDRGIEKQYYRLR